LKWPTGVWSGPSCCRWPTPSATPTPGSALEQPQFPDFGQSQAGKALETAAWLDAELQRQPWVAGERFTIADITAFCAVEFARLMRFKPADKGFAALQAWRDKVAARPSALV